MLSCKSMLPRRHPVSIWKTWSIKVAYTFGQPITIPITVKARNIQEAESKAYKLVKGKCMAFSVCQ